MFRSFQQAHFGREKGAAHGACVFSKEATPHQSEWWRTGCGSDTAEIMSLALEKRLHNSLKLLHQGGLKI